MDMRLRDRSSILVITALTSAVVGAVTLAGCASVTQPRAATPSPSGSQPAGTDPSGSIATGNPVFDDRARAVIRVWTDAGMPERWSTGFVPLQDLTVIPADPHLDEHRKLALLKGDLVLAAPVPAPVATGVVRFPDGSTMRVPLLTAPGALAAMRSGSCAAGECSPLPVTGLRLATTTVLTSRGEATVPAWRLSIDGLDAPVYRVAAAPAGITQVPAAPAADRPHQPELRSAQNLVSVHGRTVTFRLGLGMCDKNVEVWVYQAAQAVVVGGTAQQPAGICADALKLQPETVTLSGPIGGRAILDAVTGQPLLVR